MKLSLNKSALIDYISKQLETFYPDGVAMKQPVEAVMPRVLERLQHCFSHIHKKYYFEQGEAVFNHLNSDHYAMFLYFLANEAYQQNYLNLAEKAFLLNKAFHGIDAFYAIRLPEIFLFIHPIGTILGNALYSDYFVVYQNVTIGTEVGSVYPRFGKATVLYAKSSVIGECNTGENVCIAGNTFIRNISIPDNSIAVGTYPDTIIKPNKKDNIMNFFA